jgi:hypothetical protein
MPNESDELKSLKARVKAEIDGYVYSLPENAIGNPWPSDKVAGHLDALKRALVEPYWTEVETRDTFEQVKLNEGPRRRCVVVADNRAGYLLLWDPDCHDFFLAQKVNGALRSFGVRGDAVGCFFAI